MLQLSTFDSISAVKGVGESLQKKLSRLDIHTIEDLLWHVPISYLDRTSTQIDQCEPDQEVTITGAVSRITSRRLKGRRSLQSATLTDHSGSISLSWFNQPFLTRNISEDSQLTITGKVKNFRGKLTITVSEYAPATQITSIHSGKNTPVYSLTHGITQKSLRRVIKSALSQTVIDEWIPQSIVKDYSLAPRAQAFHHIHFPQDQLQLNTAQHRLAFEELLLLQIRALQDKRKLLKHSNSYQISMSEKKLETFKSQLPFTLTSAQERVIQEILADLSSNHPANRLVQGDVGAGKTVVAAAAIKATAESGFATALMAPTELLATQHYKSLKELLENASLNISLQTRSHSDAIGNADCIIGTHALLFRELPDHIGLVIIDEQHRFGVNQRNQLLNQPITPNLLSLTATPIPRTIALTLYADLDISIIDELPKGRKKVKTWIVPEKKRADAYRWMKEQMTDHDAQIFIVCPLIEQSEAMPEVKSVTQELEHLQEIFGNKAVQMVHGKIPAQKKETIIKEFSQQTFPILLATPVIEVGIDIKHASIMVIENAERFGLAALHQLRGRVGRNQKDAYCLLFSKKQSQRLKKLEETNSGIKLAEYDLKLRGAGEIYGTRQSGHFNLKVASLHDSTLINNTHQAAKALIGMENIVSSPPLTTHVQHSLEKSSQAN